MFLEFLNFLGLDLKEKSNKEAIKEIYLNEEKNNTKSNDDEVIKNETEEIINMENAPIETKIEEEIIDDKKIKRIIILRPISSKKAIKNVITEISNNKGNEIK